MNSLTPKRASSDLDWVRGFFGPSFEGFAPRVTRDFHPAAEVVEHDQGYLLNLEVPGVNASEVEITVEGKTLLVKGEKARAKQTDDHRTHILERHFGRFERSFTFPTPIDADAVEARAKDGVLGIFVRKHPEVQPRRITVRED